jgi:hypothetical protein
MSSAASCSKSTIKSSAQTVENQNQSLLQSSKLPTPQNNVTRLGIFFLKKYFYLLKVPKNYISRFAGHYKQPK